SPASRLLQPASVRTHPTMKPPRSSLLAASFVALAMMVVGGSAATATDAAEPPPIVPRETISLFNGKDLSAFTTWEIVHHLEDPDRVFSVVDQIDGAPAIRISGQYFGGLITKERYANYRLVVEFRWGAVTWEPRKARARDNGILV